MEINGKEEGERGEEKKNIEEIRGLGKHWSSASCGPDSPPQMKNALLSGKTWKYGKKMEKSTMNSIQG